MPNGKRRTTAQRKAIHKSKFGSLKNFPKTPRGRKRK